MKLAWASIAWTLGAFGCHSAYDDLPEPTRSQLLGCWTTTSGKWTFVAVGQRGAGLELPAPRAPQPVAWLGGSSEIRVDLPTSGGMTGFGRSRARCKVTADSLDCGFENQPGPGAEWEPGKERKVYARCGK
ncbi:MAG: hypothetical protein U0263_02210 [Polyangiaceae bacterium]